MDALEALRIKEAAGIADDEDAVDGVARHGVPPAVGEGFCAVTDEFSALEIFFEMRVCLPLLESSMSAAPRSIILNESPIAWAEAEHAVAVAEFGPFAP